MSGIILVRDVMAKNVKTVRTDDSAHDAVVKMNKFDVGSVIVVNNGKPLGIITAKNILTRVVEPRLDAGVLRARDVMTSPLVTIDPDAPIEEAARIMGRRRIKKLPVMEKDKLVGILSDSDIVRANPNQIGILRELLKVG